MKRINKAKNQQTQSFAIKLGLLMKNYEDALHSWNDCSANLNDANTKLDAARTALKQFALAK